MFAACVAVWPFLGTSPPGEPDSGRQGPTPSSPGTAAPATAANPVPAPRQFIGAAIRPELRGEVLDETGRPIEGALVLAFARGAIEEGATRPTTDPAPLAVATTDGSGAFAVPWEWLAGDADLQASADGRRREWAFGVSLDDFVRIVLAPGKRLTVRVVWAGSGQPVPDAEFDLRARESPRTEPGALHHWHARTDADGRAILFGVDAPVVNLSVVLQGGGRFSEWLVATASGHLDVRLPEPVTIRGGVRDARDLAPLPATEVSVLSDPHSVTRSGVDGRFELTLFPATQVILVARCPGFAQGELRTRTPEVSGIDVGWVSLARGVTIAGRWTGELRVQSVIARAAPTDAGMSAWKAEAPLARDGSFLVTDAPAKVTILLDLFAEGDVGGGLMFRSTPDAAGRVELGDIGWQHHRVSGQVRAAGAVGKTVVGTWSIELDHAGLANPELTVRNQPWLARGKVLCRSDGTFELGRIPAGTLTTNWYARDQHLAVDVTYIGQDRHLVIGAGAVHTLRVQVSTAPQTAVPVRCSVRIEGNGALFGVTRSGTTDATGLCRVEGLVAGEYTIELRRTPETGARHAAEAVAARAVQVQGDTGIDLVAPCTNAEIVFLVPVEALAGYRWSVCAVDDVGTRFAGSSTKDGVVRLPVADGHEYRCSLVIIPVPDLFRFQSGRRVTVAEGVRPGQEIRLGW